MPTDVIMPQMGESIFEGTITKWLKKPGDPVEKDEPLLEISTDKVDAEIPAPVAGVVRELRFQEGATVGVNEVIAVIAGAGEASAPPVPAAGVDVVMPQMGESIFEGTITKWLKKPGDAVEKDEPLFEISTDKVDAEIPAPVAGVLVEIRAAEGTTVPVQTVVAVIGASGAAVVKDMPAAPKPEAPKAEPPKAEAPAAVAVVAAPAPQPIARTGRLRSSPLVRRIAKENSVDLAYVPGTGSEGRITKDDIVRYLANPAAKHVPAAPAARPAAAAPPQAPAAALREEVVPMTRMRAIIAQRMVEAKQTIPHAHMVYKVDMSRVVRVRERERAGFEQRHGVKLTYMPFIAAAAIESIKRHPVVNASLEGENIHYHGGVHLGIAVALEWGLIVPVVRNAESLSFVELARAIHDLAGRARAKKLSPEEVGGSTFTLTNAGVFGGEFGTPIINQPEAAILAIGGLRKEPVVMADAEGNDTIAIRAVQYHCLGFDHRLVDGADAGRFMGVFKTTLEAWDRAIG